MKTFHKPTERVLVILETLANTDGMKLSEIAIQTDIAKGTLFPIIKSLQNRKYVSYDDKSGHYSLGISSAVLAGAAIEKAFWLKVIHNEMNIIVGECNEVCQLGILDEDWVLYIDKVQGDQAVQLVSRIGTRLPAFLSALGKALLHKHSNDEISALYPQGFAGVTERSVSGIQPLREQLNAVAINGYAIDDREINSDTICYAVPIEQKGHILAAISVSLPFFRADNEKTERVIDSLKRAKMRIENVLNKLPDIYNH